MKLYRYETSLVEKKFTFSFYMTDPAYIVCAIQSVNQCLLSELSRFYYIRVDSRVGLEWGKEGERFQSIDLKGHSNVALSVVRRDQSLCRVQSKWIRWTNRMITKTKKTSHFGLCCCLVWLMSSRPARVQQNNTCFFCKAINNKRQKSSQSRN